MRKTGPRALPCAAAAAAVVAKHQRCKGEGQKDTRATVGGPGRSEAESDCTVCRCCYREPDCCFRQRSEGCLRVGWSNTASARSEEEARGGGWVGRGDPRPQRREKTEEAVAKGSWEGRLLSEEDGAIGERARQRCLGWMLLNRTTSGTEERGRQSSSQRVGTGTVSRPGEGLPNVEAGGCENSMRESG